MHISLLKKIIIFLVVLVCIAASIVYFGIHHVIATNMEIADLAHTVSLATKKQQNLVSTEALVGNANPDILRVTNSIVQSDGDVTLIEYLETVARTHGLQVVIDSLSLSQDKTFAGTPMSILNIKMEVKGSWSAVYQFASVVETLPYIVKINRIDIVNSKDLSSLDAQKSIPSSGPWQELVEMSVLKRI